MTANTETIITKHVNKLGKLMHPKSQAMKVTELRIENPTMKTYRLQADDAHELAYFHAGQYIPVYVEIEGNTIMRPYAFSSSPEESISGFYEITVKRAEGGYVSGFILDNWELGSKVTLGAPEGFDYYNPMRDAKHIIGLAGGCGVTLYRSMAKAIIDGTMDCELTLFYGCNNLSDIAFKDEWPEFEKESNGKFKCIHVIANEKVEGMAHGLITVDLIKECVDLENSSIFIDGSSGMVNYIHSILDPLELKQKYVRYGVHGDGGYIAKGESKEKKFSIKTHQAGAVYELEASGSETVHVALERAGLKPPAKCRSGVCGACRAFLISGDISFASDKNGIRKRDKELGFFHTCCCFPTSDIEIIINR